MKPPVDMAQITWTNRYSQTDESDEQGRWARVAYAGKTENFGFDDMRSALFEIAWITKGSTLPYCINFYFPQQGKCTFNTLDDAKEAVQERFDWFLAHCI